MLAKVVGLGERALGVGTDAGRAEALRSAHATLAAYLRPRLRVSRDGVACAGALSEISVRRRQQVAYALLSLSYECPGTASGSYRIRYDVFAAGGGVVDDHTSLTDYVLDGERGRFVFGSAHRELRVGDSGALSSALRFVALGAEHILKGFDHVLFVIALLLGARGLVGVVKIATAFTLAHSLTLALAVVGWVDVPEGLLSPSRGSPGRMRGAAQRPPEGLGSRRASISSDVAVRGGERERDQPAEGSSDRCGRQRAAPVGDAMAAMQQPGPEEHDDEPGGVG